MWGWGASILLTTNRYFVSFTPFPLEPKIILGTLSCSASICEINDFIDKEVQRIEGAEEYECFC